MVRKAIKIYFFINTKYWIIIKDILIESFIFCKVKEYITEKLRTWSLPYNSIGFAVFCEDLDDLVMKNNIWLEIIRNWLEK